jgi:hypothetical protein
MAIVINGSGTVTGISVGGLPDGIVDAGTLATNSVDSAELIDGSIDTAHIAADQITSAIMPTGSVLQVKVGYLTGATTSSNSYSDSGLSVAITPSSTSSKILCDFGTMIYNNSTGLLAGGFQLVRDSTSVFDTSNHYIYDQGKDSNQATTDGGENMNYLDSPNTTSAVTYKIQIKCGTNGQAVTFLQKGHLTLMEVAG